MPISKEEEQALTQIKILKLHKSLDSILDLPYSTASGLIDDIRNEIDTICKNPEIVQPKFCCANVIELDARKKYSELDIEWLIREADNDSSKNTMIVIENVHCLTGSAASRLCTYLFGIRWKHSFVVFVTPSEERANIHPSILKLIEEENPLRSKIGHKFTAVAIWT